MATSSVDIDLLYLHFCQTKKKLSEFIAFSEELLYEYKQGTHTSELSRKQIEEIAHLLPPRDQWTTPIFDEKKDLIIRKYRLPSRKAFNRAVEVIKNHREFRAIIGDEQRLPYLTEDAIRVYRSCADYLSFSYVSKDNDGVKEQLNEAQKKTKELRELSRELTSEQIIILTTFGRPRRTPRLSARWISTFIRTSSGIPTSHGCLKAGWISRRFNISQDTPQSI